MGITVRELMKEHYFSGFQVVAGHGGTDHPVSSMAILDAPDGLDWVQGNELVLCSGYVFAAIPDLFDRLTSQGKMDRIAALGIKMRFLGSVPDPVRDYFDEKGIPLILVPENCSWPESIFQFNMLVFNNALKMFDIHEGEISSAGSSPYDEGKIARILSRIEYFTKRPAMLYDRVTGEEHYSSSRFRRRSWFSGPEEFLDDRYRLASETLSVSGYMYICGADSAQGEPSRWLVSPIDIDHRTDAFLVVMEGPEPVTVVDRMTLRVGQSLLRTLYERKKFSVLLQDMHFENLAHSCIESSGYAGKKLLALAKEYGISLYSRYQMVYMENPDGPAAPEDFQPVRNLLLPVGGRQVFSGEKSCLFLIPFHEDPQRQEGIRKLVDRLPDILTGTPGLQHYHLGICLQPESLLNTGDNLSRCRRSVTIGRRLDSGKRVHHYSDLGPFAWIDIHEDTMSDLVRQLRSALPEDADTLLHTLKVYLGCRMNYSLTAQELYLHINTVRKRIETVRDAISYNLDDPLERLKLELLLTLLEENRSDIPGGKK